MIDAKFIPLFKKDGNDPECPAYFSSGACAQWTFSPLSVMTGAHLMLKSFIRAVEGSGVGAVDTLLRAHRKFVMDKWQRVQTAEELVFKHGWVKDTSFSCKKPCNSVLSIFARLIETFSLKSACKV